MSMASRRIRPASALPDRLGLDHAPGTLTRGPWLAIPTLSLAFLESPI